MGQSKHINVQVVGTPDDRSAWKSLSAKDKMYLGEWIRKAIDDAIAARSVQQNAQSSQYDKQSMAQIEVVAS